MKYFQLPSLLLVALLPASQFFAADALAQWSTDPNVNNPICTTVSQQQAPRIVSDGSNGAIICWWDLDLTASNYDIYAQRINADGTAQWITNGIAICTNSALQHVPEMTSDGNGGAVIAWQDNRSGSADIYAQRINGNGIAQWAADGVPVCAANSDQTSPQIISDGNGGTIITWRDLRGGTNYVPYAQKLDGNGLAQWTTNGVLLSTGTAETPQIISDENEGAIITWHQYTGINPNGNLDIIAQRVLANGDLSWGNDGVVICALTTDQRFPQLVSDDDSGAIIVWEDYRNANTYSNLYAQRVNAYGVTQWLLNGEPIAPNTLSQIRQRLLRDGSGGLYTTWQYGTNEVFAQRLNSNGDRQWANDGVSIGGAGDSRYPDITTDGGTGAIITWYDYRGSGNGDIFAQRIDTAGTIKWIANGVGVCRNTESQVFPRLIPDGNGGAIVTWEDARNSVTNSTDVYAQQISVNGSLGEVLGVNETAIDNSIFISPNPFSNRLLVNGTKENGEITILNMTGKEVMRQKTFNAETKIKTEGLLSGFYFLSYSDESKTTTLKLLKF